MHTSRRFTDADNTGAPLVPIITDETSPRDRADVTYMEEVIWSHRR